MSTTDNNEFNDSFYRDVKFKMTYHKECKGNYLNAEIKLEEVQNAFYFTLPLVQINY